MATYSIDDLSRRDVLAMLAVVTASSLLSPGRVAAQTRLQRTPGQILGPFYPLTPLPATSDLTKVPGRPGRAQGHILNVMGKVLNLAGEPVRNATVEVWQSNAHGRYAHPSDPNPAPLARISTGRRCYGPTVMAPIDSRPSCRPPIRPGRI